jgi:hypothetical protein
MMYGLMKTMAKQTSTVKLPDGQYTQSGKGTLKELFRVHFSDSKLTEDSNDGQDRQILGICQHITNMKLEPGQMCDQSIKN